MLRRAKWSHALLISLEAEATKPPMGVVGLQQHGARGCTLSPVLADGPRSKSLNIRDSQQ